MPEVVDECVQSVLADPNFKPPKTYKGDRESFAWAICNAKYKKGQLKGEADPFAFITIDGQTYYSPDENQWFTAALVLDEPSQDDLEYLNRMTAALTPGSIIKFSNAALARAEVNKNLDEIDEKGIEEIAASLTLKPIDIDHDHQKIAGWFIKSEAIDNAVMTSGLIYAGRWPDVALDLVAGKGQLSIDARAKEAICAECGAVFTGESEYCSHINRAAGGRAVRKMRGLMADGGSIVKYPAGTDTQIPAQSLRMIAQLHVDKPSDEPGGNEMEDVDLYSYEDEILWMYGKQLTYKEKQGLPDSAFALIQKKDGERRRRFPIQDCAHARNALARLPNAKDLSAEERATVKRKAEAKLNSSECKKEKAKGGTMNPEELQIAYEETLKEVERLTTDLEASQTEAARLEEELQAAKKDNEALATEKDAKITEAAKRADEAEKKLADLHLEARLKAVEPYLDAEELEEQKEDIAAMPEGAFKVYASSLEAANKSKQSVVGSVIVGEEDDLTIKWA
jgi:uncharacterized C2H2 Zn-finger protein